MGPDHRNTGPYRGAQNRRETATCDSSFRVLDVQMLLGPCDEGFAPYSFPGPGRARLRPDWARAGPGRAHLSALKKKTLCLISLVAP